MAAAGAIVAVPRTIGAQPAGKTYRIGIVEPVSAPLNAANLDAFRRGLRELGYVEGQNIVLEYRSADGHQDKFPELATELVRLNVDVILTTGTPAALAVKRATATIPVVIAGAGDPVGSGIVASLARPGGNVTGVSAFNVEIYAKRVELLKELVPKLARIAGLFNMGNPVLPRQWKEVERPPRPSVSGPSCSMCGAPRISVAPSKPPRDSVPELSWLPSTGSPRPIGGPSSTWPRSIDCLPSMEPKSSCARGA